jgi:hypothetical protein
MASKKAYRRAVPDPLRSRALSRSSQRNDIALEVETRFGKVAAQVVLAAAKESQRTVLAILVEDDLACQCFDAAERSVVPIAEGKASFVDLYLSAGRW